MTTGHGAPSGRAARGPSRWGAILPRRPPRAPGHGQIDKTAGGGAGIIASSSEDIVLKLTIPVVMSLNAGVLDTAGFLALQGLFTAHVTGNFVTLGASVVFGGSGAAAKLLALPVFCGVIIVTRLLAHTLPPRGLPILRTMLTIEFVLLVIGAALAIAWGPFKPGDAAAMMTTGMVLVAAMAIQNAASRIHLATAPPTTLMTGTTTQMMIDIADLLRGVAPEARLAARARLARMTPNLLGFALGCALGACLFAKVGNACFALPALLAVLPILMPDSAEG
jgi:uncharacterized membrane protein YoaK (UPF0700 family)